MLDPPSIHKVISGRQFTAFLDVQIHGAGGTGFSVPTRHFDLGNTVLDVPFFISMFHYCSAGGHVGPAILYRNPLQDPTKYPNDFKIWCYQPEFQVVRADGTAVFTANHDGAVLMAEEPNSYNLDGIDWATPAGVVGSDLSHDDPFNRVVSESGGLLHAQFSGSLRVTSKNA